MKNFRTFRLLKFYCCLFLPFEIEFKISVEQDRVVASGGERESRIIMVVDVGDLKITGRHVEYLLTGELFVDLARTQLFESELVARIQRIGPFDLSLAD